MRTTPPITPEDDALARVALEAMNCPACDYPLRGLKEKRCPECGRELTWANIEKRLKPLRAPIRWMNEPVGRISPWFWVGALPLVCHLIVSFIVEARLVRWCLAAMEAVPPSSMWIEIFGLVMLGSLIIPLAAVVALGVMWEWRAKIDECEAWEKLVWFGGVYALFGAYPWIL